MNVDLSNFILQYNFGQSGGPVGYDVNVVNVWLSGFTGKGVVVCILDDGIENTHPDLVDNYASLQFMYLRLG